MSSGTNTAADLFEGLWTQLRECHNNALQELEAKVIKLKKDRCLDAQRLEVFYNRQQQLKEQNKTLQDAISHMEERLRDGECDRCAVLGESLQKNQDENGRLVTKLKDELNSLRGENTRLLAELQKLKTSQAQAQQTPSETEHDECFIPDSPPVLPSSLPVANRLKMRRNPDKMKRLRYAETPLLPRNDSLFNAAEEDPVDATRDGKAEVLVPNTCQLDASQIPNDATVPAEEAVAETCGLELLLNKPHVKTATAASQQSSSKSPRKFDVRLKPYRSFPVSVAPVHSPDSTTERSPSLLSHVRLLSEDGSLSRAKRRKEEREGGAEGRGDGDTPKQPQPIKHTSAPPPNNQSSNKQPSDSKLAQTGTSKQKEHVSGSPVFKKPSIRAPEANKEAAGKTLNPRQDCSLSHQHGEREETPKKCKVEPMWSIDPALELSMYNSEGRQDEQNEETCPGDMADTDCTWVSHSMLHQAEKARDKRDSVSGIGKKANDSLDVMFDTSAYGEYKSFNSPHMGQPCEEEEDDDDDENEGAGGEKEVEEEDDGEQGLDESTLSQRKANRAGRPNFAHVAVIRKKEERRKLKGTTCKECEVYYANLPEGERQKKLSSCSRHRFLYIPPSTPENFWEVGFPSTQTCIDRGYIREENTPQARTRRRQPFNVLFSPKQKTQNS